jgi:hypothetical protein
MIYVYGCNTNNFRWGLNMVSQTINNKRCKSWYIATSIIFLDIIHRLVELYLLDPTE